MSQNDRSNRGEIIIIITLLSFLTFSAAALLGTIAVKQQKTIKTIARESVTIPARGSSCLGAGSFIAPHGYCVPPYLSRYNRYCNNGLWKEDLTNDICHQKTSCIGNGALKTNNRPCCSGYQINNVCVTSPPLSPPPSRQPTHPPSPQLSPSPPVTLTCQVGQLAFPYRYCSPLQQSKWYCGDNGRWQKDSNDICKKAEEPNSQGRPYRCIGIGGEATEKYPCCVNKNQHSGVCFDKKTVLTYTPSPTIRPRFFPSPTANIRKVSTPTLILKPTATIVPTYTPTPTPVRLARSLPSPTPVKKSPTPTPFLKPTVTTVPTHTPVPTKSVRFLSPPTPTLKPTATIVPTYTPIPTLPLTFSPTPVRPSPTSTPFLEPTVTTAPTREPAPTIGQFSLTAREKERIDRISQKVYTTNPQLKIILINDVQNINPLAVGDYIKSKQTFFQNNPSLPADNSFSRFMIDNQFWGMTHEDLPKTRTFRCYPNCQFYRLGPVLNADETVMNRIVTHESAHNLQAANDNLLAEHVHGNSRGAPPIEWDNKIYQAIIEGFAERRAEVENGHWSTGSYANYRCFYHKLQDWSNKDLNHSAMFDMVAEGGFSLLKELELAYNQSPIENIANINELYTHCGSPNINSGF